MNLQTSVTEPVHLIVTIVLVDALFILTATVFLSTGGLFGRQRYPVTLNYPGVANIAYGSPRKLFFPSLHPQSLQLLGSTCSISILEMVHARFDT